MFTRTEIDHVHDADAPQLSEPNQLVHDALWRGSGGWEIAAAPVAFGLIGWLIDGAIGIRPVLTVVFAIIGLAGAFANLYLGYTQRMARLAEERKAAHVEKHGESAGPRFGRTEAVELPSYAVPADLDRGANLASPIGKPGISTEVAANADRFGNPVGKPGISTEVAAEGRA